MTEPRLHLVKPGADAYKTNNLPAVGAITADAVTMTSLELVAMINEFRARQAEQAGEAFPSKGFAELQHKHFLEKVLEVIGKRSAEFSADLPDSYGRPRKGYRFPKREACLMAMSYSYELQAAVYDRLTALEEELRGAKLPDFFNPAMAARAWAEEYERRQIAEGQRNEAIRTKAEIGCRREATSMATASVATRKANHLADELGRGRNYRQVKAVAWLGEEFDLSRPGAYSQIGKKLTSLSLRLGYEPHMVPDERYPKGVRAYHVDVVNAFRSEIRLDRNMLRQYRR